MKITNSGPNRTFLCDFCCKEELAEYVAKSPNIGHVSMGTKKITKDKKEVEVTTYFVDPDNQFEFCCQRCLYVMGLMHSARHMNDKEQTGEDFVVSKKQQEIIFGKKHVIKTEFTGELDTHTKCDLYVKHMLNKNTTYEIDIVNGCYRLVVSDGDNVSYYPSKIVAKTPLNNEGMTMKQFAQSEAYFMLEDNLSSPSKSVEFKQSTGTVADAMGKQVETTVWCIEIVTEGMFDRNERAKIEDRWHKYLQESSSRRYRDIYNELVAPSLGLRRYVEVVGVRESEEEVSQSWEGDNWGDESWTTLNG